MPTASQKLTDYDPDCADAAAELWLLIADHEGEDADAQLVIARALKEYACECDKRITSDQWAQKYRGACEQIGRMMEALEFYANKDHYRLSDFPNGSRPIWDDEGAKARASLQPADESGPHFVLVGYNDNGTPCAALTAYAASAGLDAVKANGVLMFHDAGHPHVKSVEAISWPARR